MKELSRKLSSVKHIILVDIFPPMGKEDFLKDHSAKELSVYAGPRAALKRRGMHCGSSARELRAVGWSGLVQYASACHRRRCSTVATSRLAVGAPTRSDLENFTAVAVVVGGGGAAAAARTNWANSSKVEGRGGRRVYTTGCGARRCAGPERSHNAPGGGVATVLGKLSRLYDLRWASKMQC